MTETIGDRVRQLIHTHFDGSVNAAAGAYGMAQPTLHRIAYGNSASPRTETLAKIAAYHEIGLDWLARGVGAPPSIGEHGPLAPWREWKALVASLALSDATALAVHHLPEATARAYRLLTMAGIDARRLPSKGTMRAAGADGAWRAKRREVESWTALVKGLVASYGAAAVRERLESLRPLVQLGFQPFATQLFADGKLPADLDDRFAAQFPANAAGARVSFDPPQVFATPPLEQPHAVEEWDAEQRRHRGDA